jgi:alcohol dehydrogenase class IV
MIAASLTGNYNDYSSGGKMNLNGTWNYPTQMRFGAGRIAELPDACRELGMTRPLLVTDSGLAEVNFVREALAVVNSAGLPTVMFSNVRGNPTDENVIEGLQIYREGGHDGVIALGGGSGIDAAKTIAMMAGQNGDLWDYLDRTKIDRAAMAPVVALPTTAGTGSEVGRAAIITETAVKTKRIVGHPAMLPGIVISDPNLTAGLPPGLTAATGIDALVHCLEAYCASSYHPQADGIALEGMRLIHDYLPRAFADGGDIEARAQMLAAASMGAIAFQKGLGGVHAISHAVGARYDTHHGLTNAVVVPYILRLNRPVIEDRMVHLARVLGLDGIGFEAVMNWLLALRRDLNIPHSLGEIGVPEGEADEIAALAAGDPTAASNPVPLDAAVLKPIFLDCVHGRL